MNRDEILNMPAGKEMDKLVAEKVMDEKGFKSVIDTITEYNGFGVVNRPVYGEIEFPCYSTSIVAAWDVVEKMQNQEQGNWFFNLQRETFAGTRDWYAEFGGFRLWGNTAPLAICRAALLAINYP
jgi:hypothetical protein